MLTAEMSVQFRLRELEFTYSDSVRSPNAPVSWSAGECDCHTETHLVIALDRWPWSIYPIEPQVYILRKLS